MNPFPICMPSDQDRAKSCNIIRWESGERVDPRLLTLLDSFGEIYVDRHEVFQRIVRGDHEELFKKIGDTLKNKKKMKKFGSMKRSMSMRSIKLQRGVDEGTSDRGLRLERFKVRTPIVIVAGQDDDGQDPKATQSSNGSK